MREGERGKGENKSIRALFFINLNIIKFKKKKLRKRIDRIKAKALKSYEKKIIGNFDKKLKNKIKFYLNIFF